MKKNAIFLRGNMRTWNCIKEEIIKFFDHYHDKPDWYVCLWKSNTASEDDLKYVFRNSNLKFLRFETGETYEKFDSVLLEGVHTGGIKIVSDFVDKFSRVIHPYWRLAYLDQILSMEKRKFEIENNINYHSVFFVRPDIIYKTDSDYVDYKRCLDRLHSMEITHLKHFNIAGENKVVGSRFDNYVTSDTFILTGSIASDIFGTRFIDTNYTDGSLPAMINWDVHQLISKVVSKYHLYELADVEPNARIAVGTDIIRPDNLSQEEWGLLSVDTKRQICQKWGIDPYDYNLNVF